MKAMLLSFEEEIGKKYGKLLVCLLLTAAVVLIYRQTLDYEFIDYDDISYVTENHHVKAGLTAEGLRWALTDISTGYWHPLAWLSHMLDGQLFGANPGGHHLTSILFHAANSFLLFVFFLQFTGELWKSAFVAALFAVHPLNVESVVWVAERKNVLSTFFWLAAMISYGRYAKRPGIRRYLTVIVLFTFGLMAKPMAVTLPFALLLLDYWPLRRLAGFDPAGRDPSPPGVVYADVMKLIAEKIPLFTLAAAASVLTYMAGKMSGALVSIEFVSLKSRLINASLSYAVYIGKMFWPRDLSVFYPYGGAVTYLQIVLTLLLIIVLTLLALSARRKVPALLTGWFWFMGTLVPVIGLVQAGGQAMADRYAYIPFIGLFVMIAWGIPPLFSGLTYRKTLLAPLTAVILVMLSFFSWKQAAYWQNSVTLFTHAIKVTKSNVLAYNNLGAAQAKRGMFEEAVEQYRQALQIKPGYIEALNNMGLSLMAQGKPEEAAAAYLKALQLKPDYADAHNNMGIILSRQGRLEEAKAHYNKALFLKPDYADARNNMGCALAEEGKHIEALPYFLEALRLRPDDAQIHYNIGLAFLSLGNFPQARRHFLQTLTLNEEFPAAKRQLDIMNKRRQ